MYQEYLKKLNESILGTKFTDSNYMELFYESGMEKLVHLFIRVRENKKQLFFIGNGGSSAIASHMTADFMKNGQLKTYSLYDNAVTTCMSNDYGYEYIFSKPLEFLAEKDDLLVAISSSGESSNIINAIKTAQKKGSNVITFTGFQYNNRVRQMGDYNVYVPVSQYGMVESIHNLILQQVVDMISLKS